MNHILRIVTIENKFVSYIFGCSIIKYGTPLTELCLNHIHPLLRSEILTTYVPQILIIAEIIDQSLSHFKGVSSGTGRRVFHINSNTTGMHQFCNCICLFSSIVATDILRSHFIPTEGGASIIKGTFKS